MHVAYFGHLEMLEPYWTLRAISNDPCELSHISLTALARSAQWAGVYARGLDALVRNGGRDHHDWHDGRHEV